MPATHARAARTSNPELQYARIAGSSDGVRLLPSHWYRQLRAGYVFLRTLNIQLQLLHNQQTHELPSDHYQLEWLPIALITLTLKH